jgi:preprotein translocase subunit YajC
VLPEENKVVIESGPGTVLTVHRQAIGTIEQPVADTPLDDELGGTEVPDDLSSLTPVDEDRTETTEARSGEAAEDAVDDAAVREDAVETTDETQDETIDDAVETDSDSDETDSDSDDETRQNRG